LFHEDEEAGSLYRSTSNKKGWVSSFGQRTQSRASQLLQSHHLSDNNSDEDDDEGPSESLLQEHHKSLSSSEGLESIGLNRSSGNNIPDSEDEEEDPPDDIAVQDRQEEEDVEGQRRSKDMPEATELPFNRPDQTNLDTVWSTVYLLSVSMLFATSLIVWLRTSVPKSVPLGDTIYTLIKSSWSTIILTTLLSILLSAVWILFMKRYATGLIYLSIVSVPVVLVTFTVYPMVMSYRSGYGGNTTQDRVMRWTSLIPLVLATGYIWLVYKGRHVLQRSLNAIQLCCTVVTDNKPLLLVGSATVCVFIVFTFIWIGLFTRVFLRGKVVNGSLWVLDGKSWFLGACYVFVYLWTWGVMSGIQRSIVAATVSQWYFHRHDIPQVSPLSIVKAASIHSTTVHFGTVCYSSFVCLMARVPILILPKRLSSPIELIIYSLLSADIARLTSPLTLTAAVIRSQRLLDTTRSHNLPQSTPTAKSVYKLSKLLLTTARGLTSIAMGFAAWTHAAKYTNGGSLYGYIVGLIAGFIGWFVLAGTEGTLSMILDALSVSHAIDSHSNTHCMEAQRVFQ
jgi:hypothetical protein